MAHSTRVSVIDASGQTRYTTRARAEALVRAGIAQWRGKSRIILPSASAWRWVRRESAGYAVMQLRRQ